LKNRVRESAKSAATILEENGLPHYIKAFEPNNLNSVNTLTELSGQDTDRR
jgi:hypothetical protein